MNITNPINRRRRRNIFSLSNPIISNPVDAPPPSDAYNITGTITGPVVEGVIVYVLNSATRQIVASGTSNALGNYIISNLPKNISYDVLPVVDSHTFTPDLYQVTLTNSNIVLDFTSVAGGQYLFDDTTISIVDDSNTRLWEAI